jgi:hypothetical protein
MFRGWEVYHGRDFNDISHQITVFPRTLLKQRVRTSRDHGVISRPTSVYEHSLYPFDDGCGVALGVASLRYDTSPASAFVGDGACSIKVL